MRYDNDKLGLPYSAASYYQERGAFEGPVVVLLGRTCGHCLESETVCECEDEPPC
jgi:hypothetical protein